MHTSSSISTHFSRNYRDQEYTITLLTTLIAGTGSAGDCDWMPGTGAGPAAYATAVLSDGRPVSAARSTVPAVLVDHIVIWDGMGGRASGGVDGCAQ
ncbi:MAG: hypothetical protein R3B67_09465 [Phycisphaerales bacterium]